MSDELTQLLAAMSPWQRTVYDQLRLGRRSNTLTVIASARQAGRTIIARALELSERESTMRYLNPLQNDVTEFHEAFGHPAPHWPVVELTPEIVEALHNRADWLREEADELEEALEEGDLVKVLDALGDSVYFGVGGFTVLGHEMTDFWGNIHDANMAKLGPDGKPILHPVTGKVQKPEGWVAPEPRHEVVLANIRDGLEQMDAEYIEPTSDFDDHDWGDR